MSIFVRVRNQIKYCTSEILIRKKTLHFHWSTITFLVKHLALQSPQYLCTQTTSHRLKTNRLKDQELWIQFFSYYIFLILILFKHDWVLEKDVCSVYCIRPSPHTANLFGWIDNWDSRCVWGVPRGRLCVWKTSAVLQELLEYLLF